MILFIITLQFISLIIVYYILKYKNTKYEYKTIMALKDFLTAAAKVNKVAKSITSKEQYPAFIKYLNLFRDNYVKDNITWNAWCKGVRMSVDKRLRIL